MKGFFVRGLAYNDESCSWLACTELKIILGLLILIAYHQTGEALMYWSGWPIPGSVIGMLLLLLSLMLFNKPPKPIKHSAEFLLRHLSLLFVPAGVGMMLLFDLIADQWVAMLLSLVLSTVISLAFTAWLMQILLKFMGRPDHE